MPPTIASSSPRALRITGAQGKKGEMFLLGILLSFLRAPGVHCLPSHQYQQYQELDVAMQGLDCQEMRRDCLDQRACRQLFAQLDACLESHANGTLEPEGRQACVEVQSSLLHSRRRLLDCRCQRGLRKEEKCLRFYWTLRFPHGYDDIESSPYEDMDEDLRSSFDTLRINSLVAGSSPSLDGQNQCLRAAQDCGANDRCGVLRSDYVAACTRPAEGSEHCDRHRCHRALRRFLERLPETFGVALLTCPCFDTLCGERRRKTIVPSCSYEDHGHSGGHQPNCLHLKEQCMKDFLCRARLADFQHHCFPYPLGCARESRAMCLKAYTGLIGTILTPNYVKNSSMEVALWCTCDGSGNHWDDCQHLQSLFTHNTCLDKALSTMGSYQSDGDEVEAPPPARPSQLTQHHRINPHLLQSSLNSVEGSEETTTGPQQQQKEQEQKDDEEEEEEEVEEEEHENGLAAAKHEEDEAKIVERFRVIPPYSEKATVSNLNSGTCSLHMGDLLGLRRPLMLEVSPPLLVLLPLLALSSPHV